MARAKRPTKKKLEQAELKELNAVQFTIVASEMNLQRLAALLMFADHHKPVFVEKQPAQLPYEEDAPEPELEINRVALENAVAPLLEKYLNKHGREKTQDMIKTFGVERAFQMGDQQLLILHDSLAAEAAGE